MDGRFRRSVVDPGTRWTRRKLQALVMAGIVIVGALVFGAVWMVVAPLEPASKTPPGRDRAPTQARLPEPSQREQLAAEPLPAGTLEQAQPGPLSTATAGTLKVPGASAVGEAGVPSGFPQTPEGALAQLAAIDQTALTSASVQVAQDVIARWAAPGGPTTESWSGVRAVAALLSSVGGHGDADDLLVTVTPAMGLIKGQDGDDFVIPCVDLVVELAASGDRQSVAVADCQRMSWNAVEARWVIGPGEEPAEAPALWPGTQSAYDAGYEWIEVVP